MDLQLGDEAVEEQAGVDVAVPRRRRMPPRRFLIWSTFTVPAASSSICSLLVCARPPSRRPSKPATRAQALAPAAVIHGDLLRARNNFLSWRGLGLGARLGWRWARTAPGARDFHLEAREPRAPGIKILSSDVDCTSCSSSRARGSGPASASSTPSRHALVAVSNSLLILSTSSIVTTVPRIVGQRRARELLQRRRRSRKTHGAADPNRPRPLRWRRSW